MPTVSILTPSLDQVEWLRQSLDSVALQSYDRIEHVVVDGGSSDGSATVLRQANVRLLELAGSSQADALNAAFLASSGEIVGWLNTDDAYVTTEAVAMAVDALRRHPDAVAVYGDGFCVDGNGRILRHICADASRLDVIRPTSPLCQPSVFFRRDVVGGQLVRGDLELFLDYELWLRLRRRGSFVKVNEVLAIDRDHPRRKTQTLATRVPAEMTVLASEYDLTTVESRTLARARRWRARVRGVLPLVELATRRGNLAFDVWPEPTWRRLVRQLFVPQRFLHAA